MTDDTRNDIANMLAYRKKKFAVEVTLAHDQEWNPGGVVLSLTTNGTQWSSFLVLPEEIDRVIQALEKGKTLSS